jgi:Peptidase family S41
LRGKKSAQFRVSLARGFFVPPSTRLLGFFACFAAALASQAFAQAPSPAKPTPNSPEQWSQAAITDVRAAAAITAENHPGYVDPVNPGFKRLLVQAESNGLELARQVNSAAGYVAAIRRFSNTLQDGHAGAYSTIDSAILPKQKWPGFVAVWRGNAMLVYDAIADAPQKGARITACDGVPIATLVRRNVFTFRGRPSEPGNWWSEARRVFVDSGNPFITLPRVCTFVESGRSVRRTLVWQETNATFNQWRDDSYNGVTLPVGLTKRPGGLVWIAMPTFQPDEAQQASYRGIVAQITAERDAVSAAPAIVLDLRDNQGGSSVWSKQIANALWGQARRNRRMGAYVGSNTSIRWRTSNGNARHVEALVPKFIEQGLPDLAVEWTQIYKGMDAARARGEPLYTEVDDQPIPANMSVADSVDDPTPLKAPIYVIVPGQCASACLDALDVFTRFENVKLIGAPSSADSTYMDIRSQELPSGLGAVIIPNKVYVGRARGPGFAYRPSIEVRDLSWSTQVFERVILQDIGAGRS